MKIIQNLITPPPLIGLKIIKISSKKSHSSKACNQYQELAVIYLKCLILFNFIWQNYSIFNNSIITIMGLNITKPPQWTPYSSMAFQQYQEHSGAVFWEVPLWQKGTNKQCFLINRLQVLNLNLYTSKTIGKACPTKMKICATTIQQPPMGKKNTTCVVWNNFTIMFVFCRITLGDPKKKKKTELNEIFFLGFSEGKNLLQWCFFSIFLWCCVVG